MLFKRNVLDEIARGTVTTAFRRWRRPTVRAGSQLRTAIGVLQIDAVEPFDLASMSERSAREAGYESLRAAEQHLAEGEGLVYRVRFRLVGEDPRIALRNETHADFEDVIAALRRLDKKVEWTRSVLDLIRDHPGVLAQILAGEMGMERLAFKRRVRQLKELGLTESLEVGYRLSPRGHALLAHLQEATVATPKQ